MFNKGTNLNVYTDWLSEKVNPDQDLTTPELIDAASLVAWNCSTSDREETSKKSLICIQEPEGQKPPEQRRKKPAGSLVGPGDP